jgi:hypothetical protein
VTDVDVYLAAARTLARAMEHAESGTNIARARLVLDPDSPLFPVLRALGREAFGPYGRSHPEALLWLAERGVGPELAAFCLDAADSP